MQKDVVKVKARSECGSPIMANSPQLEKVSNSTPLNPQHKTLADLGAKDCRYPYGDKLPYTFCGQRQKEGSVYCEEHAKLCHSGKERKQWYERKFG